LTFLDIFAIFLRDEDMKDDIEQNKDDFLEAMHLMHLLEEEIENEKVSGLHVRRRPGSSRTADPCDKEQQGEERDSGSGASRG
jgi:hypothetical protein